MICFEDKYTLGKTLGEGSFSIVRKGKRIDSGDEYAIKICCKAMLEPADLDGLRKEIQILHMIRHNRIITLFDVCEDAINYYLVTELVQGGELFDRIVSKEFYDENDVRAVCRKIFEAIAHCHEHKVAHRDLKPENLLLVSKSIYSDIKVADFGFATLAASEKCLRTQCGTAGYIAPEILMGLPYGTMVDCWSLGVITYILLGGYLPFSDRDKRKLYEKTCAGAYEFHSKYWSHISDQAKDFVKKLMVLNPAKRLAASEALKHPWLTEDDDSFVTCNLSENLEQMKRFNAKRKLRAAVFTVVALNKLHEFRSPRRK